jgi:hypothetical protein
LAKNWLTQRSIIFCLAIRQQLSAGHYKSRSIGTGLGDINNNEQLIINLATVQA